MADQLAGQLRGQHRPVLGMDERIRIQRGELGMIVAGAAALYLADWLGTTRENYLYSAWQLTYLAMAGAMLVGVFTTLSIREPARTQESSYLHTSRDYFRFVLLFAGFVAAIILAYLSLSDVVTATKSWLVQADAIEELASFVAEAFRLFAALLAALAALAAAAAILTASPGKNGIIPTARVFGQVSPVSV